MSVMGLHIADILVIVAYFSVVLYIGYRAMKKVSSQEDYFLGGRSFGKLLQTFSMFGQATSTESVATSSSIVAQKGMAGVFFSLFAPVIGLPIWWFMPLWLRRSRLMTLADLFIERYRSRGLAVLYTVAQVVLFIMVGGMGLYAMSKTVTAMTIKPASALTVEERVEVDAAARLKVLERTSLEQLTPADAQELKNLRRQDPQTHFSYVNRNLLIICIAVFVVLYAIGGGLEAAVWTDAMQSVFILILTVMLIPFAMFKLNATHEVSGLVGPFQAVHRSLPSSMLELFGSPELAGFSWHYILLLSLITIAGMFAYANNLVVAASSKTEQAARSGSLNGLIIKRASMVVWAVLALFILTLYGHEVRDPDLLWGLATRDLLPVGLVGLMIACLTAALMSTADTHMLVVSALITNNLYRPVVKNRNESHYLTMGRVFGLVHIVGAVVVAMNSSNLFELFKFMIMLNATMGPAILMAFLWRKANASGAWCSMGVSLLVTLIIPLAMQGMPGVKYAPSLLLEVRPDPIVRSYTANQGDVDARQKAVDAWDEQQATGSAEGQRPAPLTVGERFEQTTLPPAKAIFWVGSIKTDADGRPYGNGFFRPELYLLHRLGLKLEQFDVSVVESLSLLFKLIFPFAAILVFGWFGRRTERGALDFWYGKLLTPVAADRDDDAREVALTREHPHRFDQSKRWPMSDWMIRRWTREDWRGVMVTGVAIVAIFAALLFFAGLGKG